MKHPTVSKKVCKEPCDQLISDYFRFGSVRNLSGRVTSTWVCWYSWGMPEIQWCILILTYSNHEKINGDFMCIYIYIIYISYVNYPWFSHDNSIKLPWNHQEILAKKSPRESCQGPSLEALSPARAFEALGSPGIGRWMLIAIPIYKPLLGGLEHLVNSDG